MKELLNGNVEFIIQFIAKRNIQAQTQSNLQRLISIDIKLVVILNPYYPLCSFDITWQNKNKIYFLFIRIEQTTSCCTSIMLNYKKIHFIIISLTVHTTGYNVASRLLSARINSEIFISFQSLQDSSVSKYWYSLVTVFQTIPGLTSFIDDSFWILSNDRWTSSFSAFSLAAVSALCRSFASLILFLSLACFASAEEWSQGDVKMN